MRKETSKGSFTPRKSMPPPASRPPAEDGPAEKLFASIAEELLSRSAITTARMFGSTCLKVSGKVFAVVYKGRLVLKLPADRVEGLVKSGHAIYFDPGHGRTSKEWVSVPPHSKDAWLKLATEAHEFVASIR